MSAPKNTIKLRQLTDKEGNGWLALFPDLHGCMSDGKTPEEALYNAAEAEVAWLAAHQKWVVHQFAVRRGWRIFATGAGLFGPAP